VLQKELSNFVVGRGKTSAEENNSYSEALSRALSRVEGAVHSERSVKMVKVGPQSFSEGCGEEYIFF